jgi:SAM-dependent methyltransferase
MGWTNEAHSDPIIDELLARVAARALPLLTVADVGAGHGAATAAAIERGAAVTAIEIHADHLAAIAERVPAERAHLLTLVDGEFPESVALAPGSQGAVLLCRVLHFFSGARIERAIAAAFAALAPGGVALISAETPFRSNLREILPAYEARAAAGDPWPGELHDVDRYFPDTAQLPPFMNFLDHVVLARALRAAGFAIERAHLFSRPYLPPQIRLDGREGVGVIAIKPGAR